jgi:alkyl sulfatase BDS1-like metallo-beta-lactamase superfamily hydrolase
VAGVVDDFRIFIDPDRSADVDTMLSLRFTDADDATCALIVRRGVCEFVADPAANPRQPDLVCSLTRLAWARLFTGEASARELVAVGDIEAGEHAEAVVKLLEAFDPFDAANNQTIRSPARPSGSTQSR